MNTYKIPAPYSKKGGKKYFKIELQSYKFSREKNRVDRVGKMFSYRIDNWDVYNDVINAIESALAKYKGGK